MVCVWEEVRDRVGKVEGKEMEGHCPCGRSNPKEYQLTPSNNCCIEHLCQSALCDQLGKLSKLLPYNCPISRSSSSVGVRSVKYEDVSFSRHY